MWLKQLKIAIIERDTDKLDKLLNSMPDFDNLEDMQSASALLKEVARLLYELKDKTSASMKLLKKNIDFMSSTQANQTATLDIKS